MNAKCKIWVVSQHPLCQAAKTFHQNCGVRSNDSYFASSSMPTKPPTKACNCLGKSSSFLWRVQSRQNGSFFAEATRLIARHQPSQHVDGSHLLRSNHFFLLRLRYGSHEKSSDSLLESLVPGMLQVFWNLRLMLHLLQGGLLLVLNVPTSGGLQHLFPPLLRGVRKISHSWLNCQKPVSEIQRRRLSLPL